MNRAKQILRSEKFKHENRIKDTHENTSESEQIIKDIDEVLYLLNHVEMSRQKVNK
jgi:hypothetical protein